MKTKNIAKKEKTTKITVVSAWSDLFERNETAKKKMTDEQLYREMVRLFPDKKGKTTLTRVNGNRALYNAGVNAFESRGKPRRMSRRYGEDGKVLLRAPRSPNKVKPKTKLAPRHKAKVKIKVRVKASKPSHSDGKKILQDSQTGS